MAISRNRPLELIFCERCNQYKPDGEFYTKDGNRAYSTCRNCRRIYGRQWMQKSRGVPHIVVWEILTAALGGCCARCGYSEFASALEIADPDISTKISNVVNSFVYKSNEENWNILLDKIDQHILLCANCNRSLRAEAWSVDDLDPAKIGPYQRPPMPVAP